jgi:cyclopropane fatty-acyl-phospholipid synthase-like methyltransferase
LQKIGTGKTVLEIGVGDGHFLIACARKGNSVIGVDISTVVIRRLKPIVERGVEYRVKAW